jgi:hypothetical protein
MMVVRMVGDQDAIGRPDHRAERASAARYLATRHRGAEQYVGSWPTGAYILSPTPQEV